ncbi:hypothetical protein F5Y13DRAFT_124814 [Hypoxylon sp. FL1857]|nr:hypothetical protein F5Y13DRAFT_124814 [Hypoxylon sp. FL1857]
MAPSLEALKTRLHNLRRNHRGYDSTESRQSSQPLDQTSVSATTSSTAGATPSKRAPKVSGNHSTTGISQPGPSLPKPSNLQDPPGNKLGTSKMSSSSLYTKHSNVSPIGNAVMDRNSHGKASVGNSALSNELTTDAPLGSQYNPIDLTGKPSFNQTYESFPFDVPSTPAPKISTKAYSKLPASQTSLFAKPSLPHYICPAAPSAQGLSHPTQSWDVAYPPPHGLWSTIDPWFKPAKLHGNNALTPGPAGDHSTPANATAAQLQYPLLGYSANNPSPRLSQLLSSRATNAGRRAVDLGLPQESREPSVDPEQTPEDITAISLALEELKPLRQFVHGCFGRNCSRCARTKTMDSKDVVKMTIGWVKSAENIVLGATCQNVFCTALTCLGCGKPMSSPVNKPSNSLRVPSMNSTVHWCCDSGRLAAIWALACGWEASTWKSQAKSSVVNRVRGRTHAIPTLTSNTAQVSFPSANAKGVGYGSNRLESFPFQYFRSPVLTRATPKNTADTPDNLWQLAYFRLLAALLPSRERQTAFDASPPEFLLHILSRSPLIEKAAVMLSNDSIGEISRQYQLHDATLDLFDALGSHPSTTGLVYNDRNLYYAKGGSLLDVSIGPVESNSRIIVKDTGRSLIALLGNLATQSQTVLRHAQSNSTEFHNHDGVELLKLSQRLSEISTRHTANTQQFRAAMELTNSSEINFAEWHRENCVRDAPDETIMQDFACVRDGAMLTGNPSRGRMKRLITELSTLQTSLPEGIFIYHGSSRLDIMKVLIIGPKQTPYEHGLFEFDLWCPMDYPNSPPRMTFRTTNGGRIRFNPNLYEDGKICLSLLGTWSGEPWRANQSTLLQVLVSIQSMILCEQPWYNEPGREHCEDMTQSAKYNNDVRAWTMKYALLPWINATGTQDTDQDANTAAGVTSFWREAAQLYLRANAKDILHSSKQAKLKSMKSSLHATATLIDTSLQKAGYLD